MRWRPRTVLVTAAAALAAAVVGVVALGVGDFPLSPAEVVSALQGRGTRQQLLVVQVVRLPRVLTGAAAGAALALAGALVITMARNALASPDLLGITAGGSAGAVAVITLGGTASAAGWLRQVGVPTGALLGAALAGMLVWVLTRRGHLSGVRPLLVGVGVSSFFAGVVALLLVAAPIRDAARANVWLTGSLNQRSWPELAPLALTLALVAPVLLVVAHRLHGLHLGTDVARATGTDAGATARLLGAVAVALTAVAAAACGPLGFVALVAPHAARLATGASRPPLVASAAVGALVVLSSDLLARQLFAPVQLPAGAVIAVVGGPVLVALLVSQARRTG